jgi:hypothetical protein
MPNKHQDVTVLQNGVDDVVRSIGSLVDSSVCLAEKTADVMERELALVIRLSQRVRDEVIAADTLASARKQPVPARFREDAHAIVDLVADIGAVFIQSSVNFIDGLTGGNQTTTNPTPVAHTA